LFDGRCDFGYEWNKITGVRVGHQSPCCGKDDQKFSFPEGCQQSGQYVVVPKLYFLVTYGVVLVDDGDDLLIK
jgi:hypothetical protein